MPGSMEPFSPAFPPLVPAEASRHQFKVHHLFSKLKVGKKLTQQVPGPVSAKQNPSALSAHLGRYLAGRGHLLNPKIPDFPSFPCVFVTGKTKKLLQGFFSQLCLWRSLKAPLSHGTSLGGSGGPARRWAAEPIGISATTGRLWCWDALCGG